MRTIAKYMLLAAAAVVVAACALLLRGRASEDSSGAAANAQSNRIAEAKADVKRPARRQRISASKVEEARRPAEKPTIDVDEEEEAKLAKEMVEVLDAIREALKANDFSMLQKAIARMKALGLKESGGKGSWLNHVPERLKLSAVSSLGWFGSEGIPELIEFLGDENADVAEQAMNQFELALQDFSLGDRGRAEIIKTVSQIITDSRDLDWILTTALDSRPSVGVDTFSFISANGTPEAREMIGDYIDFFTGGEGVRTAADAEQWLVDHPDEDWAEDFFGPIK